MKDFVLLFEKIDQTKSTKEKTEYIKNYFLNASFEEAVWALFLLSGHKIKRLIGPQKLFQWCIEYVNLPAWLCEESYAAIGDLAETISLLLPINPYSEMTLNLGEWINQELLPMKEMSHEMQKKTIHSFWKKLNQKEIFIVNKLLTGSLRVGVSYLITLEALSLAYVIPREVLMQRMMGNWDPDATFFKDLISPTGHTLPFMLNPYPFYLASPLADSLETLGDPNEWFAEWKWDGIRAQIIKKNEKVAIWSRGNELITEQFPEIEEAIKKFPTDIVLDGELLAYTNNHPLPFSELQKRLGRKKPSKKIIQDIPITFMVYDILEHDNKDVRKLPLKKRRGLFENFKPIEKVKYSPLVTFNDWEELILKKEQAYQHSTEGLIIKNKNSTYGVGRKRGGWWKFKIDPKTIDAILIYAQPGSGWRASLYTDYTFGVWKDGELVPIAKAYSGLNQEEILLLDKWIRKNTLEKFGPVRKVKIEQVFEIAFEGIQVSSRHKSGVALRFPRIVRWRQDKPPSECDTLEMIKKQLL